MNSISPEAEPFALATALMAVILLAALIRVWLLRRLETKLLNNLDELEKQMLDQQQEVMTIRKDANDWRAEMKRQFDVLCSMTAEQTAAAVKRFDDLLNNSQQRQAELQAALDLARQMCAELPAAKARVMQLEQVLEIDSGEGFSAAGASVEMSPLPDLGCPGALPTLPGQGAVGMVAPKPVFPPVMPSMEEGKAVELEQKLASALQRNATLQQALTAARLRSRAKAFPRTVSSRPQPL